MCACQFEACVYVAMIDFPHADGSSVYIYIYIYIMIKNTSHIERRHCHGRDGARMPDARLPDSLPDVRLPDARLPDASLLDASLPDASLLLLLRLSQAELIH